MKLLREGVVRVMNTWLSQHNDHWSGLILKNETCVWLLAIRRSFCFFMKHCHFSIFLHEYFTVTIQVERDA